MLKQVARVMRACMYGGLNSHPIPCFRLPAGSECVALLLQQLDAGNRTTSLTAPPTAAPSSGGSSADVSVVSPSLGGAARTASLVLALQQSSYGSL